MDVIAELGPIFLGSRLKRLAERFQAGAARVIADAGLPVQPAHMPLLAALSGRRLTVGELVAAVGTRQPGVTRGVGQLVAFGLVAAERGTDARERLLSLTPVGEAAMARTRALIWPRVGTAVSAMCAELSGSFLDQVGGLEAALTARPLDARVRDVPAPALHLLDWNDALAADFHDINVEWIEAMFAVEPADREVLEQPRARIVDAGGAILFAAADGLGVIGTCALRPAGDGAFELTKMGVRARARGLGAGDFLLRAALERAASLGARDLFLLSNSACATAIRLYEKAGFVHDAEVMATRGARYARCDVAMRYPGPLPRN